MKYKFHFLIAILLGAFLAFAWAPFGVKTYLERRYEGVTIGGVAIQLDHITLKKVLVSRSNVVGTLDEIQIDFNATGVTQILIYGGSLIVTEGSSVKGVPTGGGSLPPIIAAELQVHVKKDGHEANLEGVSFTDYREPKFRSFTATVYDASGQSHQVKGRRGYYKDGHLYLTSVVASESLPFEIPGIPKGPHAISANNVEVILDGPVIHINDLRLGDHVQTDLVTIEPNIPTAVLHKVTISHPYLDVSTTLNDVGIQHFPFLDKWEVASEGVLLTLTGTSKLEGEGACQDWANAIPTPVSEAFELAKPHFHGTLSWEIVREPTLDIKIKNLCKFECSAEPIQTLIQTLRANGKFEYQAYNSKGELFNRTVGPRLGNWVRYANLPPWVPKAFVTLEDPGFWKHRGIIPQALENSLKANIEAGHFFRGGSTITMQLVKNLWLTRQKTLNRKAQELLMTSMLETCLSKQEIFELYVNVVEFGSDLYGIGAASRHYFDSYPEHLTQEEAYYFASILPNPRRAARPENGGLARTRRLMQRLADRGFISDDELLAVSDPPEPIVQDDGDKWESE